MVATIGVTAPMVVFILVLPRTGLPLLAEHRSLVEPSPLTRPLFWPPVLFLERLTSQR